MLAPRGTRRAGALYAPRCRPATAPTTHHGTPQGHDSFPSPRQSCAYRQRQNTDPRDGIQRSGSGRPCPCASRRESNWVAFKVRGEGPAGGGCLVTKRSTIHAQLRARRGCHLLLTAENRHTRTTPAASVVPAGRPPFFYGAIDCIRRGSRSSFCADDPGLVRSFVDSPCCGPRKAAWDELTDPSPTH